MQRASFDPAQIQHVPDEAAQPLRFPVDGTGDRPRLPRLECDVRIHQVAGRGSYRGERRPKVVRYRVQHGGL